MPSYYYGGILVCIIDALWPSKTTWCLASWSILVQVMAWYLLGTKPLPSPMLTYCWFHFEEHILGKFDLKSKSLYSTKCTWKWRLQNVSQLFSLQSVHSHKNVIGDFARRCRSSQMFNKEYKKTLIVMKILKKTYPSFFVITVPAYVQAQLDVLISIPGYSLKLLLKCKKFWTVISKTILLITDVSTWYPYR